MGHFTLTCALSGLPVEGPVRALLLTQNPHEENRLRGVYPHDLWVPRTIPMKANYDGYGSIENWSERDAALWLAMFQRDLFEVGVGDNSIHDSDARKTMDFPRFLCALSNNRIFVLRYPEDEESGDFLSFQYIESLLQNAGLDTKDYLIDDQPTFVRVRRSDYCLEKRAVQWRLSRALTAVISEFPHSSITEGSGAYADDSELRIYPTGAVRPLRRLRSPPLRVKLALIREDVWKACCNTGWKYERCRMATDYAIEYLSIQDVRDFAKQAVLEGKIPTTPRECRFRLEDDDSFPKPNPVTGLLGVCDQIFLAHSMNCLDADLVDAAAEFEFIQSFAHSARKVWMPSFSSGPQDPEWKVMKRFCGLVANVARKNYEKERAEAAEWGIEIEPETEDDKE